MDNSTGSTSIFKSNVTVSEVMEYFNLSMAKLNITNESEVSQIHLFDLFEAYKTKEKEQLMTYKFVAYVLGSLIVLSNLIVVVSSGLILKKGQQPKSTYLLLGNVSLADTIIGISVIFGASVDNSMSSDPLCIFQLAMLVCPAMVSIFSVGLIAIDRYIYILHGLYYQRWFNTTRVRIGILCIWMIGIILGFMPSTGWVNKEPTSARCIYIAVFPGTLILLNSLLSVIPIIVVAVLYTIILTRALKNFAHLKSSEKIPSKGINSLEKPRLRIYRGRSNVIANAASVKYKTNSQANKLQRSASYNVNYGHGISYTKQENTAKAKSTDDLTTANTNRFQYHFTDKTMADQSRDHLNKSEFSITSVVSSGSDQNLDYTFRSSVTISNVGKQRKNNKRNRTEPNKLRAITIVTLTSGSFIFTWTPFFVVVILFVLCEEKLTQPNCLDLYSLLNGPLVILAFINSLLNPMIYAWWHKGFKNSIRIQCKKYFQRCF
ncbi:glucose-dependent insulinotropic receptor-like isoform X2 [Plodia interpunctella]|uniref:glucose-dependent insulinotropic receptor-like isoform X2 n=1 Tax=Plodia interpunctella TaxID=58824 RepID=UPI002367B040|nr:glucose-dependent insulinotropic receptor-like isoform X2 [Plodia interpunctella]